MKSPQIAMLYTGKHFKGFGVAVDGQVIAKQLDARIEQEPACHGIAKLHVTFSISREQMENPLHIDIAQLNAKKDSDKVV